MLSDGEGSRAADRSGLDIGPPLAGKDFCIGGLDIGLSPFPVDLLEVDACRTQHLGGAASARIPVGPSALSSAVLGDAKCAFPCPMGRTGTRIYPVMQLSDLGCIASVFPRS